MKNSRRLFLSLAILGTAAFQSASAAVETYVIDPVHSSIGFSIRHFVSKVPGSFTKLSGTITLDTDALEKSSAEASIDVASINTANEKRDGHLKSADFFDTANFPTATFKSTAWKKTGEDSFDIAGDLTLHGVTKEVVLKARLLGIGEGRPGVQLSGWEATTTIDKSAFGISGPAALGKVLGDEVAIHLAIEAVLKTQK